MMAVGTAHAQAIAPPPDLSLWQIFAADPSFLVVNFIVLAMLITIALIVRRRYARFYTIQREALDHRKVTDAEALAHNHSIEQLISRQHGVTNAYNQQVIAQAEEALRLSTQTLAAISTVNQSLTRIADRLDRIAGPAA